MGFSSGNVFLLAHFQISSWLCSFSDFIEAEAKRYLLCIGASTEIHSLAEISIAAEMNCVGYSGCLFYTLVGQNQKNSISLNDVENNDCSFLINLI